VLPIRIQFVTTNLVEHSTKCWLHPRTICGVDGEFNVVGFSVSIFLSALRAKVDNDFTFVIQPVRSIASVDLKLYRNWTRARRGWLQSWPSWRW